MRRTWVAACYEGGRVPVLIQSSGRPVKRQWVSDNPNWCKICREAFNWWPQHHSKSDHHCQEMSYTAIMNYPRRWNCAIILDSMKARLNLELAQCHNFYKRNDNERRLEILHMIQHLIDQRMILCGPNAKYSHVSKMQGMLQSMLIEFGYLKTPLMKLYPDADVGGMTYMTGFLMSTYNLECVFDLCGFKHLRIDPDDQKVRGAEGLYSKPGFIRAVIGQLRWCMERAPHPLGFEQPPHLQELGEITVKALLAEIVDGRVCEYIVRAEPVWRESGMERRKVKLRKEIVSDNAPALECVSYRPLDRSGDDRYFAVPEDRPT